MPPCPRTQQAKLPAYSHHYPINSKHLLSNEAVNTNFLSLFGLTQQGNQTQGLLTARNFIFTKLRTG